MEVRRLAAQEDSTRSVQKSWPVTPEYIGLGRELRNWLERAVLALPPPHRLVLILRDMEQLETREVAEVMDISEAMAKMRLHRARAFVRNTLEKYLRRTDA